MITVDLTPPVSLRKPRRVVALLTAAAVALGGIVAIATPPAPARAAELQPVEIVESTGPGGFTHPGIGLSADDIRNAQQMVVDGVEPWASYYDAMTQSPFATKTYVGDNVQFTDEPKSDAYNELTLRYRANRDSLGAMTQTFMYLFTGDEVYRANAMKTLRAWSKLDPNKYGYFADAHIHTPTPMYQFAMAAEILRSAPPVNETYEAYPLAWTEQDTEKFGTNFIRPNIATFLNTPNRYLNQHNYGVIGALGGAIFLDDADLYAERTEWFTVNAGFSGDGDYNGSLKALFREIDADDPLNAYGETYVQHQEMGRDQAHAWGDVVNFGQIARILQVQGTKLDPVAGTVSTASDAVTAYGFLDDRILTGANEFAAFMEGEDVRWIDTSGGPGALSQAYRGRLFDAFTELYYQYKYVEGVDVDTAAPALALQYQQREGAFFYNGVTRENATEQAYYQGMEYWLAFPPQLADENVTVPQPPAAPEVGASSRGITLGAGASRASDAGVDYLRLDPSAGDASASVRQMVWGARTGSSLVGVRVRSDGDVVLSARRTAQDEPYASVVVPDTGGQWRYVTWDIGLDRLPVSAVGENILFLTADGDGAVDVASVIAQANGRLSPVSFTAGPTLSTAAVAGAAFSLPMKTDDPSASLRAAGLPEGASFENGTLSWTPTSEQTGEYDIVIGADDGQTVSAQTVHITVTADRDAAIDALASVRDSAVEYTTASVTAFDAAVDAARTAVGTATDSEFSALLEKIRTTGLALTPLNPRLSDGSLAFPGIATSTQLAGSTLATLIDGDNQTFWGDLKIPSVVLDFGSGYRVSADKFGFQARNTFGNRSQGTNVYGSNDGSTWTLLTVATNTGRDDQIEWIDVAAEHRDDRYRFLKLQVDEPGVPSDPAYPGIWSLSEFRIDGDRAETVGVLDSVKLTAPGSLKNRVVPGDAITLTFTSPAAISAATVRVAGAPVPVATDDGRSYTATTTVPAGAPASQPLRFTIDYKTSDGRTADTVAATTDGSRIFVSRSEGLLDPVLKTTKVIGADGRADSNLTAHAGRLLDGNITTFTDVPVTAGRASLEWDFGEGGAASISGADILVRQDQYGLSRLNVLRFEGSNDRSTWTALTNPVVANSDWQHLDGVNTTAFRYIRLTNGNIINLAEARVFGTYTAPVTSVQSLKISSSNSLGNYAVDGDTITLDLTTKEPVSGLTGFLADAPITFTQAGSATQLRATANASVGDQVGKDVPFRVEYVTASGQQATPVTATTDDSYVRLGTNTGLITDLQAKSTRITLTGAADTSTVSNPQNLFDGKLTTHTDTRVVSGSADIIWDVGATRTISIDRLELAMRQDQFGTSRISNLQLMGSNDRTSWTVLARNVQPTLVWQSPSLLAGTPFRYLRLTNGNIINIAEMRLYGAIRTVATGVAPASVTTTQGTLPTLPKTVDVTYADASTTAQPVVWDEVTAAQVAQPGEFTVAGKIASVALPAAAKVTVEAASEPAVTITDHPDAPIKLGDPLRLAGTATAGSSGFSGGKSVVSVTLVDRADPEEEVAVGTWDVDVVDGAWAANITTEPLALTRGSDYVAVVSVASAFGGDASDEVVVQVHDGSTAVPARGALSSDNGWDSGLQDGDYNIVMDLWWGENARIVRLIEDGKTIAEQRPSVATPAAQKVTFPVSEKPNGTYTYTAELVNSTGVTTTASLKVTVKDANPAIPVLSHNNWDGDGNYTITANLRWGTNATSYTFYENGAEAGTGNLTAAAPNAQKAQLDVSGKPVGTYAYTVVFRNNAGETKSAELTVRVTK